MKICFFNFSNFLRCPSLLVPNNWNVLWLLLLALSLSLLSLLLLWLSFFYKFIKSFNKLLLLWMLFIGRTFNFLLLISISLARLPCFNFFFVPHDLQLLLFWFLISTSLGRGWDVFLLISSLWFGPSISFILIWFVSNPFCKCLY